VVHYGWQFVFEGSGEAAEMINMLIGDHGMRDAGVYPQAGLEKGVPPHVSSANYQ